jgi:anti-sigma regulatory factor (Ser/Thr protein kinase)
MAVPRYMGVTRDVVPSGPVPTSFEQALPVEAGSVREARRLGAGICGSWHLSRLSCDDIQLVISELAANAVRHGATGMMLLRVLMTARCVRVELCENSPGAPVVRQPHAEAESGRGMWLVSALAVSWGVQPHAIGKTTWAEVAVEPAAAS